MKKDKRLDELRKKAKNTLEQKNGAILSETTVKDIEKLIEELNIHQIELEIQNNELQKTNEYLRAEQEKYRNLYEHAPVAYFTLNRTGNIYEINAAAACMLQVPQQTIYKTSIFPYLQHESKVLFNRFFKKVFQDEGEVQTTEINFVNQDNHIVYTQVNAHAYFDIQSNQRLCRCAVTDITKLTHLQQAVKESQERFRLLTQNSFDIISILDAEGTIVYESDATQRILGYTPNKRVGRNVFSFVHPDDMAEVITEFKKYEKINTVEFRFRHKDGTWRWLEACGQNYLDVPHVSGIIVNSRDITERKEREEALKKSERKLQTIFDILKVGITITDDKGNIIDCNTASEKILGITKEQHLKRNYAGSNWKILRADKTPMPPEEFASVRAMHENRAVSGTVMGIVKDNNQITWITVNAAPINIKGMGVAISYIDITKELKISDKLQKSEERWRFALEGANDGVWDWNIATNEVFFSKQWKNMLGYRQEEIANHLSEWEKRIHPDDKTQCLTDIQACIDGKTEAYSNTHRVLCKDGSYKWILDRGKVIEYDKNGNSIRMIGTHTDLTQRVEMEQELIRLNADKDRFMQILAHDLRSPFNALLGITDMLLERLETYSPAKLRYLIGNLHDVSTQTYNLLQDLLLWSKAQAGNLPFHPENIRCCEACKETLHNMEYLARQKRIKLNYSDNLAQPVKADKNMLHTIVRNLVSNAIKFTHEGGEVGLSAKATGQYAEFVVSDNGIGISPENQKKLWNFTEPYTTKGTKNEQGTGLGLLLCKEFVEVHGGRIWIESEEGKGTSFFFTLPLAVAK